MKALLKGALVASLFCAGVADAADAELAKALAIAAGQLRDAGKLEKAKSLCYKSLANDDDCPEALYELGLVFQQEGRSVLAGDFFARSVQKFRRTANGDAERSEKLRKAEALAKESNPYALKLTQLMERYSQNLERALKESPDRITAKAARARAESLRLVDFVAPDQMPDFGRSKPVEDTASVRRPEPERPEREEPKRWRRPRKRPEPRKVAAVTNVPVEIERELKKAGWSKITGTWKKIGNKTYEVTDGCLEAEKTNGAVSVIVHRGGGAGGSGTASAFVRSKRRTERVRMYDGDYDPDYWAPGYGFKASRTGYSAYMPAQEYWSTSSGYSPYKDHTKILPANFAKNLYYVQVMGTKLELRLNNKKVRAANYNIDEDGVFTVIVKGKRVIENPMAGGR